MAPFGECYGLFDIFENLTYSDMGSEDILADILWVVAIALWKILGFANFRHNRPKSRTLSCTMLIPVPFHVYPRSVQPLSTLSKKAFVRLIPHYRFGSLYANDGTSSSRISAANTSR
jgi:hypothetical protein